MQDVVRARVAVVLESHVCQAYRPPQQIVAEQIDQTFQVARARSFSSEQLLPQLILFLGVRRAPLVPALGAHASWHSGPHASRVLRAGTGDRNNAVPPSFIRTGPEIHVRAGVGTPAAFPVHVDCIDLGVISKTCEGPPLRLARFDFTTRPFDESVVLLHVRWERWTG